MELKELTLSIPSFSKWNHSEKIKCFGWYLHKHKNHPHFTSSQIKECFETLNLSPPSSISPFLSAMASKRTPELLKNSGGFRLEARVREQFESQYGQRNATIHVHKLLSELPSKIPSLAEKSYLEEALICFKNRAFRAAVVMTWNLAYDHLCQFVLAHHLSQFNAQLPKSFPKLDVSSILKRDDFNEIKESQVLQVCKSATIISGNLHKILKEKLDRRNIAAHPSGIAFSELTAEEFITDLIENVVLKLK